MQCLNVLDADRTIERTSPESMVAGLHHAFADRSAVTAGLACTNFSNFRPSEFYYNGQSFMASDAEYDDIQAFSASCSWPGDTR